MGNGNIMTQKMRDGLPYRTPRRNLRKLSRSVFFLSVFLGGIILVHNCGKAAEKGYEGRYVSDVALKAGDNAVQELEKDGYEVLPQNLNMGVWKGDTAKMPEGGANVYFGYKLSSKESDAVTGICVAEEKSPKIKSDDDGCTYKKVSEISIDKGVDGGERFLYYTKSKKAGNPIVGFDFSAYQKKSDNFSDMPLLNDGSSPIRTDEGKLADFDEGRRGLELYIMMVRTPQYLPYVSEVRVASGGTMRDAVKAAGNMGCDFYVDKNLYGNDEKFVVIGYNRTDDKGQALTGLYGGKFGAQMLEWGDKSYTLSDGISVAAKGRDDTFLYYTRSGNSRIMHIYKAAAPEDFEMDAAECARLSFPNESTVASLMRVNEGGWQKLMDKKDVYRFANVKADGKNSLGISMVMSDEDAREVNKTKDKAIAIIKPGAEGDPGAAAGDGEGVSEADGDASDGASNGESNGEPNENPEANAPDENNPDAEGIDGDENEDFGGEADGEDSVSGEPDGEGLVSGEQDGEGSREPGAGNLFLDGTDLEDPGAAAGDEGREDDASVVGSAFSGGNELVIIGGVLLMLGAGVYGFRRKKGHGE